MDTVTSPPGSLSPCPLVTLLGGSRYWQSLLCSLEIYIQYFDEGKIYVCIYVDVCIYMCVYIYI